MSVAVDYEAQPWLKGWESFEHAGRIGFLRRDGETLTFKAQAGELPLLPVWCEVNDRATGAWMYLDSGTMTTHVARSLVEAAGVRVEDLPVEGINFEMPQGLSEGFVRATSYKCPGRLLLWDGTVLLEDGFRVGSIEPPREVHNFGAANIIGLDIFRRFRVTFDWSRSQHLEGAHFSLTPQD